MGIRKKMIVAFVSLAVLLFFSGVVSMFELHRLVQETERLFTTSTKNTEMARQMLDALQQQATALVVKHMHDDANLDSVYSATQTHIDVALAQAAVTVRDRTEMDNIYAAREDYEQMMSDFFAGGALITHEWFNGPFQENYFRLNSEVKDYMISAQESLRDRSSHLGDTAYRAIMPGILALAVGIIILLIFLFLADRYLTKPVVAISRALRGYLTNRIPFQVKMEGKDEVFQIKEGIEDLIAQYKRKTE